MANYKSFFYLDKLDALEISIQAFEDIQRGAGFGEGLSTVDTPVNKKASNSSSIPPYFKRNI